MAEQATIIHLINNINRQSYSTRQAWNAAESTMPADTEKQRNLVKFNISGQTFSISQHLLHKYPSSQLASFEKLGPYWDDDLKAYYFDRDPQLFNDVLNLHRYSSFQCPTDNQALAHFKEELQFWNINITSLNVHWTQEEQLIENQFVHMESRMPAPPKEARCWSKFSYKVWCFLAEPDMLPNRLRYFGLIYVGSVVFSSILYVVLFALSTDAAFRIPNEPYNVTETVNDTELTNATQSLLECNRKWKCLGITIPVLWIGETAAYISLWMILDTTLRIIVCPSKKLYFKSVVNWLDFLASIGCILSGYYAYADLSSWVFKHALALVLIQALGNLRLFRIFQVSNKKRLIRQFQICIHP